MTTVTIAGNLTSDPELRYTPSGIATCTLTIAENQRKFNKQTNQWEEDGTVFMRATAWREMAENIANSLRKGMRVIAVGQLKQNTYTTRDGVERTQIEMTLEDLGASAKFASLQVASNNNRATSGNWQQQATAQDWPVVTQPGSGAQPAQPAPHAQQAMWTQADWAGGQPVADDAPPF